MAEKLEDWLNGEVAELSKKSVGELSNNFFFRDPLRPTHIDYKHFYSPADGTILYQKVVQPGDQVLEIKGVDYTLQDVMGDRDYNHPSLVIGILDLLKSFPHFPSKKSFVLIRAIFFETLNNELASWHTIIFVSSFLVTAITISAFSAPAFSKTVGKDALPTIPFTS